MLLWKVIAILRADVTAAMREGVEGGWARGRKMWFTCIACFRNYGRGDQFKPGFSDLLRGYIPGLIDDGLWTSPYNILLYGFKSVSARVLITDSRDGFLRPEWINSVV